MKLEEAIKNVKDEINVDKNNLPIAEANEYEEERTLMIHRIEAKETLLNHLTKQEKMIEKMIELMLEYLNFYGVEDDIYTAELSKNCNVNCKECIKQYRKNIRVL